MAKIIWLTGLSGAGKTTLGNKIKNSIKDKKNNNSRESNKSHSVSNKSVTHVVGISDDDDEEEVYTLFRIFIEPKSSVKFDLVFNPSSLQKHHFILPIQLSGIFQYAPISTKFVTGFGLMPRIALSTRSISFNNVTVLSEKKAKDAPYSQVLTLTNKENQIIKWKLCLH